MFSEVYHTSKALLGNMGIIIFVGFSLTSCSTLPRTPITETLEVQKAERASESVLRSANSGAREELISEYGLATPIGRSIAAPISSTQAPSLSGESISINFEGIYLPAFINTVFGDLLKVTFEIDNAVMEMEQLVTLRTAEPLSPDNFYVLVTQVLGNYGISVAYENNVYRVVQNSQVQGEMPRIIRSRAFSAVPGDMRPVFYYAMINNIRVKTMSVWLDLALRNRVQVVTVPYSNALLLLANSEDISAAIDIIEILDQPNLAGSRSLKISPAFWSADKLTAQLVKVLRAEGFSVEIGPDSNAPIKLIPVQALNTIIVFASGEQNLQHVLNWAAELDQPGQTIDTTGVYYLQVQNTNAAELAAIIGSVVGASVGTQGSVEQTGAAGGSQVFVDTARNALIFKGSAEEYSQFRSLVEQMDRAPYEVLIEATIAEVTLDQGQSLGVLLDFDNNRVSSANSTAIKSDTGGLLVNFIQDRGNITASLNAAADRNQVSILSSPRLLAASGKTATMQVGTQVPIITTQQTAPEGSIGGTSNILQQVQYRNTGVVLTISPVVNSSRRVELTVSQEVSDAQSNDTSDIQSPLILTRSIETTLSVDDGETVLLAGLISENFSEGDSGIPYLKDIPVLGNLFKTQSKAVNKTELIILLTPYIIDSRDTSRSVRDAFRSKLTNISESFDDLE
jgi:general secretion pathway protein D